MDALNGALFVGFWLVILAFTIIANTWFIWRGAKQRSEPFISSGMKMALVSLLPSMLCAGFFTYDFLGEPVFAFFLPPIWMICYGLGLLATSHFAPRSINILGWVFLFSGFAGYLYLQHRIGIHQRDPGSHFTADGNLLMGATFGVYHLIYAACTWPRKTTGTTPGGEP
ncbi:MAG: hypothetical protein WCD79_10560 [Chthoniobacteraceae bacterium]